MKKLLALCLALAMTVMVFAGCNGQGNSSTPSTPGDSGNSAPEVTGPKEVVVNLASEPPEMNSILTTSTGSMNVLRHIMDGLTILDQNDDPIPAMAESWDLSEDGLTYTFHLRKDAKWTNGDPVTAHDFIFAWTTFFTPETAAEYGSTWGALILGATEKLNGAELSEEAKAQMQELGYEGDLGFKAVDDYTIQVTMTNPYPYFLSVLAFPSMMPMNEKAYNEIGADKYGTEAEYFCTNGAYKVAQWTHEDSIVLEKNPDYYAADEIKLDKITMVMIADTGTAYNSFVTGEVDMIGLSGDQVEQAKAAGYTIQTYDDGSCWYFEFNTKQAGLNNAKVRKALTLGINAHDFVQHVVKNNSTIAYSFTPPAISGGKFVEAVGQLIQRVEDNGGDYTEVKKMLEEGLAEENLTLDNFVVKIVTDEGDTAAKNCAFFQEQWKTNLGVTATVEQMTYKARLDRMTNKDFSVVLAGWGPDYNDPMTFMDLWLSNGGNNHTSWANKDYDEMIANAIKEVDPAVREGILIEAEKLLMDEMPIGPIYNRARDYVCSERLTGIVRTAFDDLNLRWADVVA